MWLVPVPAYLSRLGMRSGARLGPVSARDRTTSLVLVVAAVISWLVVVIVFTNLSPIGNAGVQLLGALSLGAAVGFTAWPILWSAAGPVGQSRGGLGAAGRRGALIGLVVTILVVLRALDAVALPVLLFVIITAVLIEVTFTLRH